MVRCCPARKQAELARELHTDHVTQYGKPPWPGNEIALVHGARSERRVGPLAEQITAAILSDPGTPPYLQDPSYGLTLQSLGRCEAICELLWRFVAAQDVEALLADVTETEEVETHGEGGTITRRSTSRRVESALNQLRKYEAQAAHLRQHLGLTPLTRSRMAKNILNPNVDLARLMMMQEAAEAADAG